MDKVTKAPDTAPVPTRGKPTLRTIANMTGFAVTTVSRALADDPRIAQTTRSKVAKVARDVGYVPDRAAQRLRTGRTKVISLLLNTNHEFLGFTSEFLEGLTRAFKGTGYAVNITPDIIGDARVDVVENILRNKLADGVIFTRIECFDPRVRLLTEHGFPFVSHGRTDFTTPHPFVDFDNEAFARKCVAHLVAQDRKRLCMIMPEARYTFGEHLRFGFRSACIDAGVEPVIPETVNLDSTPEEIGAALRALQASDAPPDGYICVGEVIGLIVLAALTDFGVTPGKEVDVIAKRASPISNYFRPQIDTIFEDLEETGYALGKLLMRRIKGEDPMGLQVLLPCPEIQTFETAHRL